MNTLKFQGLVVFICETRDFLVLFGDQASIHCTVCSFISEPMSRPQTKRPWGNSPPPPSSVEDASKLNQIFGLRERQSLTLVSTVHRIYGKKQPPTVSSPLLSHVYGVSDVLYNLMLSFLIYKYYTKFPLCLHYSL